MVDTSQSPALGVMKIVSDRSAATLLPIMQQHLRSGSTVHSDQWAAYNRVQQLSTVTRHNTVNHSLHFVDPVTGVHTQNVESYWNRVKSRFKRMKGVHENMLDSYMDEFMWRERHGRTASTAAASLCRDISLRYSQ
jgi:transposase-like protein